MGGGPVLENYLLNYIEMEMYSVKRSELMVKMPCLTNPEINQL